MATQNVQIMDNLAKISAERPTTVSRPALHGRLVGLLDHSLDEVSSLRSANATAQLNGNAMEPLNGHAMKPVAAPSSPRRLATTVLVVDDCTLYRENLAVALASNDGVTAHVAWDLASLRPTLEKYSPQVVLLSMSTKDSAALLRAITASRPDVKVIAVGVWEGDEATIVRCAESGVTGYHLRDESLDDLLSLIDKITDGDSVCSPKVAAILLRRLSMLAAERKPESGELVLTAREIQILRMLEMGLSNREIANQLSIALHTVKNHVHSILGKLGVRTRAQAVAVSRSLKTPG